MNEDYNKEIIDESFADAIDLVKGKFVGSSIKLSSILLLFGVANLVSLDAVAKEIGNKPLTNEVVQDAIKKATSNSKFSSANQYSAAQIVNILTRTLFIEARGESKEGREAVAGVIWNRAQKNVDNIPMECMRYKQFSCWNGIHKGSEYKNFLPENFKLKYPKELVTKDVNLQNNSKVVSFKIDKAELKIWNECADIATKIVTTGKFTSKIGNAVNYLNKEKTREIRKDGSLPPFAKYCNTKVGKHHFGSDPNYEYTDGSKYNEIMDGIRNGTMKSSDINNRNTKKVASVKSTPKQKIHTIKSGDTLSKLARIYKVPLSQIEKLNKGVSPTKLQIGQKIRVS